MDAPNKIYIAEHNANVPTGYFSRNRDGVFTQEYIRKDIVDDMLKTAEDHAFLAGADWQKGSSWKPTEKDIKMLEHIIGQYETGNKNSKVMGYLPRVEELNFLKKVLTKWKNSIN